MLVAGRSFCNKQQIPTAAQNLLSFANRRIKLAQTPTKDKLSQDEYHAHRKALDASGPLAPSYADTTTDNINFIRRKFIKCSIHLLIRVFEFSRANTISGTVSILANRVGWVKSRIVPKGRP